jgi:transcriptional regulator with GAF, ATPase, and Fis domain
VRELQNLVERAVIRSNNGVLANPLVISEKLSNSPVPLRRVFGDSQRALILQALQETGWVVGGSGGAAARLGLKRTTLIAKMKKFGISRPAPSGDCDELTHSLQGGPAASCG